MGLKQQIEQDLKAALLAGDSIKVSTLRGVKSVILNEEVAKGARDTGLPENEISTLLSRESKKRQESADLYKQGGSETKADQELEEKKIIDSYLPEQLSEADLERVIDEVIQKLGANSPNDMGSVISGVKHEVGVSADGATIARLVKERLAA